MALVGVGLVCLIVAAAKKAHANREIDVVTDRVRTLDDELTRRQAKLAEVAALRSQSGPRDMIEKDERRVLERALWSAKVQGLVERLREIAKRQALGTFDPERGVRETGTFERSQRLSKVDIQIELATDWPRLGSLLAEVGALAPLVSLEEATFRRAEAVPLVGVRLILSTLVAKGGSAADPPEATDAPFAGPSPFFLASEIASGKSHRETAPPPPLPTFSFEGVLFAPPGSSVIVDDKLVPEGRTFEADGKTVRVILVTPATARFQVGERVFEKDLGPLSHGGNK
jgi:hypothetical protein